ncbi:flagellar basal body rod protein FlgC [Teredinibacter franksiae]|uniref:flagellar basal body rod protein FlgC n=1 Tax=Teredinibacter franksiae TaxID=2761453 RepID=UPI00162384E2|nr:flagellar basal body rod C-terminal domain-containing protein [Teredinibacter franksiae]
MEPGSITAISRFGMDYERGRVELAAQRLALANVAFASETTALQAIENLLINANGVVGGGDNDLNSSVVKAVHDPVHPMANGEGNVFFLDVDHVTEMVRMAGAVRAYEANVRAYNINKEINAAAIQIGDER